MAKLIPLIVAVSLLEVQTNFNPEENYCKFELKHSRDLQLNCTSANIHFFQNFQTPLNRTYRIICNKCFLNVVDEDSFNLPSRNNISALDLPNSKIRVLKKFAFGKFYALKFLNLHNNHIDTLHPLCFTGLKKLLQLDLSRNELQVLSNSVFASLENLDLLNLNKNDISNIQFDAFVGLVNLKYLYLNDNNLKNLNENDFLHLKNLKILYLERNQILDVHQNAFQELNKLNFLYMNNNSITYLVQYNFKPLSSLLDLQLRFNNLTEIQTSTFNGMKNLISLHLGHNKLNIAKPYGFIGLDSLQLLDLTFNRLKFISYFDYFSHMQNLRYLFLRKNSISNFVLNYKYEVQNLLRVLDLSDNNLTNFNIQLFDKTFPYIDDIFVHNNPWNCEFIVHLYNFYRPKNVSICFTDDCNSNVTEIYIEDICAKQMVTESDYDDASVDFTTDCCLRVYPKCVLSIMVVLVFSLF